MTRAQQPAMPVIGFLNPASAEAIPHLVAAFRRGLAEAGYVEGKNLTIEYRFTNFRPELLPEAAGDLVRSNVSAIFAPTPQAGAAVRNATTSIPIVALDLESDPLEEGYVRSLARPGGNITGMFLDLPELSGPSRKPCRASSCATTTGKRSPFVYCEDDQGRRLKGGRKR
jgi:putative ABC transport system substrate-binding protein